jgi:hypothetical protein
LSAVVTAGEHGGTCGVRKGPITADNGRLVLMFICTVTCEFNISLSGLGVKGVFHLSSLCHSNISTITIVARAMHAPLNSSVGVILLILYIVDSILQTLHIGPLCAFLRSKTP